ncbi:junctional protein associated with coronary artery disease-like [Arapaima gigas]
MYSVEDLLISHGYKPPRNSQNQAEGTGLDRGGACKGTEQANTGSSLSSRQPHGCPSESEHRDRSWRREEAVGSSNHGDTRTQGGFLNSSGGFHDGPYGMYCHPRSNKDVSYWRRRGQDFSILLDYADSQLKVETPQRAEHKSEQQVWDEAMWLTGRVAGSREPWMAAGDRKCQSLGTEEWRPAISLGRQLSDSEGQVWAHEPAEGAIHPKTKGKSLSLPRGLPGESLTVYNSQRADSSSSLGSYLKQHGSSGAHDLWTENGRPIGHNSLLPKPMFSRPVKPPSYEAHQQTRGSWEMLARDLGPRQRGQTIRTSKSGEISQEYFAHEPAGSSLGPPGYIPPPSYKRPQLQNGAQKNHDLGTSFQVKGKSEAGVCELGKWPCRSRETCWMDYQKERAVAYSRQIHPGYVDQHLGCVQYLPFHDPRVRHISGGQCGNSLTDSDKIRNIHREIPSAKVLGQSTRDSAFLPPEGLISSTDLSKVSPSENENGNRWNSSMHKENNDSLAFDQNCNENHKAIQSTRQNRNLQQGYPEIVTQVKKIEPATHTEKVKQVKRKLNETIFCLVSVPLQPDWKYSDLNNNETANTAEQSDPDQNNSSNLQDQSLPSTLSTDFVLQHPPGGVLHEKPPRKVCLQKEPLDTRSIKLSKHIELRYSGSWPGDQYRDQETQTSFCEVPEGSSQGPSSFQAQDQGQHTSGVNLNTTEGTDCGSMLTFHIMKGQKSLNPSSNSAFSRTFTYSNRFTKSTALPGLVSGKREGKDTGPEAFGQFLLKPVSRRPWDAIKELESFNKELQDPFRKPTSVNKCIEDLNEAYKDILELSNTSNNFENGRMQDLDIAKEKENLQVESHCKPKKFRPTFKSWTAADPEYRGLKSAFSRSAGKAVSVSNQQQLEDISGVSESSFTNYSIPSQILKKAETDSRAFKTDVPVQREPQRKDVGVTVHPSVEPIWVAGKLMQDASTLTSPPDYEDICHAMQLTQDPGDCNKTMSIKRTVSNPDIGSPSNSCKIVGFSSALKQDHFCPKTEITAEVRQESSAAHFVGAKSSNILAVGGRKLHIKGGPRWIPHKTVAEAEDPSRANYRIGSDCYYWRRQLSLTERHLETLLINETTSNIPLGDLSTLYQVKCAQGIPENESLEERAARILGINVSAESLAIANQNGGKAEGAGDAESEVFASRESSEPSAGGGISHVPLQSEKEPDAQDIDAKIQEVERVDPIDDGILVRSMDPTHIEDPPGMMEAPENVTSKSAPTGRSDMLSLNHSNDHCDLRAVPLGVDALGEEQDASTSYSEMGHLSLRTSDFADVVEDWSHPEAEPEDHLPVPHQPRTVAKREITLPPSFSSASSEAGIQDVEVQSLPDDTCCGAPLDHGDSYDPSHVERV